MNKKKLDSVLNTCLRSGHTFTLYVQGSPYEDSRRLLGYQIENQPKVRLDIDQVSRFSLQDFRLAMTEKMFDFTEIPQEETRNNFVWAFATDQKPIHLDYLRRKATHGVLPQAPALKPLVKEFSLL